LWPKSPNRVEKEGGLWYGELYGNWPPRWGDNTMMKVAVTGATGFLGKQLVRRLAAEHYDVRALVYEKGSSLGEETLGLEVVRGDLLKKETLNAFLKDVDLVVHLAGVFYPPLEDLMKYNVMTTANLLEACARHKIRKVIFASSAEVYGKSSEKRPSKETDELHPASLYSLTKKISEDLFTYYDDNFGIKYVILRFSTMYGPENNKGAVSAFLDSIGRKNELTIYGDGTQARDFLFVSDAVCGILQAMRKHGFKKSAIFNIGNGELTTIEQLARTIEKLLGRKIQVIYKPEHNDFTQTIFGDTKKAKEKLGWKPKISLEDGIKITMKS